MKKRNTARRMKYSITLQLALPVLRMFLTREKLPPSSDDAESKKPAWERREEKQEEYK